MNTNNLTIKTQEAIQKAQRLAMENQQQAVDTGQFIERTFNR